MIYIVAMCVCVWGGADRGVGVLLRSIQNGWDGWMDGVDRHRLEGDPSDDGGLLADFVGRGRL